MGVLNEKRRKSGIEVLRDIQFRQPGINKKIQKK